MQGLRCIIDMRPPATDDVLTRTEAWLRDHPEHRKVIAEMVSDAYPNIEFRSTVDGLLCLVFPKELGPCLAFYEGEGPKYKELYPSEVVLATDVWLVQFCEISLETAQELTQEGT